MWAMKLIFIGQTLLENIRMLIVISNSTSTSNHFVATNILGS